MRWIVRENETCSCSGLQFKDLPNNLPANIHFSLVNDTTQVYCENVAGVLECKGGNEIVIEPKYKKINPFELIAYINDIRGINVNKERIVFGNGEIDINKISDLFVLSLSELSVKDKKFRRELKESTIKSVRGKVDWVKTYSNYSRGKTNDVISSVINPNYSIVENALISSAAKKVEHLYDFNSKEYFVLLPWLKLAAKIDYSFEDLFKMQLRLNEAALSGSHAYYYNAVMFAKIILGFNNVEKAVENNDKLLFNMPNLFESYVRKGFQKIGGKYGYTVQKGFTPRSFLFCDGLCEMIPDIVIYDGFKVKAVLDVKYKQPDSKDFYQIYSYMKYANIRDAFIIIPSVVENMNIITFDDLRIRFIKVDNSIPYDLEVCVEKIMREAI